MLAEWKTSETEVPFEKIIRSRSPQCWIRNSLRTLSMEKKSLRSNNKKKQIHVFYISPCGNRWIVTDRDKIGPLQLKSEPFSINSWQTAGLIMKALAFSNEIWVSPWTALRTLREKPVTLSRFSNTSLRQPVGNRYWWPILWCEKLAG
jgi:hypothetical protein